MNAISDCATATMITKTEQTVTTILEQCQLHQLLWEAWQRQEARKHTREEAGTTTTCGQSFCIGFITTSGGARPLMSSPPPWLQTTQISLGFSTSPRR